MRVRVLAFLVCLLACGKESVHERTPPAPAPPWDAPTPENGFRPVGETCTKLDAAGQIRSSLAGTIQDVLSDPAITAVAADAHHVYFGKGAAIYRAERASSPWPHAWKIEPLVEPLAEAVTDLAVTPRGIHWVSASPGRTSRGHMDLVSRETTFTVSAEKPIGRLVVDGDTVLWSTSSGVYSRNDRGGTLRHTDTPSSVIAANGDDVFTVTSAGFFAREPRSPWRMKSALSLVAANDPVDAVADAHFLYWLERGPETPPDADCERCTTGYPMKGQPQHAQGKLRRVALAGGPPVDLYVGLPNVEHLTMSRGILWISTMQGLLRYDPSCHLPPARVAPEAGLHGRAVPFGDALAVLGTSPNRVALFATP